MRFTSLASMLMAVSAPALTAAFAPSPVVNVVGGVATQKIVSAGAGSILRHNQKTTTTTMSTSQLAASSFSDDDDETKSWEFNPLYGGLLVGFLTYGLAFSPGELFSDFDNSIISAYAANPASPEGINELFLIIFNGLGIMPIVLSQLIFPQGRQKGLYAAPFCLASLAMGYGGVGWYLSLRAPPVDAKSQGETGWVTKNVLENKIVNWGLVALCLSNIVQSGILGLDFSQVLAGFQELVGQSKLANVSSVDLTILTIAAATLIPRDLKLRDAEIDDQKANLIAASTVLLPIVGAGLYCALRPSLPEE